MGLSANEEAGDDGQEKFVTNQAFYRTAAGHGGSCAPSNATRTKNHWTEPFDSSCKRGHARHVGERQDVFAVAVLYRVVP